MFNFRSKTYLLGGTEIDAYDAVNDVPWLQNEFISVIFIF